MTPDKLAVLAARLRDHASDYITHPDDACKHSDLLDAYEYLRQCAQAEPVAWLHPANSSCVTTDPNGYARGIPLYTRPQPPSAQPDAVEGIRWEKPGPVSPNHPLECLIVLSALRQIDGDWWIEGSKFLADDLPIAWAPDTPEARAVLAEHGGNDD
jgi:hypothetical protein